MLGALVVLSGLLFAVGPAAATPADDCGGGDIRFVQAPDDPATIIGATVSNVGAACDGQPVGVQFLGNAQGDPDQASVELARAYSDEDPCTGAERPDGVLDGGTVEVPLCSGSSTADYVDGAQLTGLRLITTLDASVTTPGPTPPGSPDDPAGAPDPAPVDDDLPTTGAEILRAVVLGAALVLLGSALLGAGRRSGVLRR